MTRICADKKEDPQNPKIGTDFFRSISRGAAKEQYCMGLYRQEVLHVVIAIYVNHEDNFFEKVQKIGR